MNEDAVPRPVASNDRPRATDVVLRLAVVALALGTAYIHATLGGTRFTLNAIGYLTFAAAMIVPLGIARRYRWLIRLGLIGYAATTIVGWAIEGTFYPTAYVAKAIELTLIVVLAIELARLDGNPIERARRELRALRGRPHGRAAGRP